MAKKQYFFGLLVVAVLPLLLLTSCRSSTSVGGEACYPDGADRAAADFCLFVNIEGGKGKAYVDRSPKKINLSVVTGRNKVVLEREYSVEAGDLRWHAIWAKRSDLQVVLFEYRKPIPKEQQATGSTKVPRQILSVAFALDESKGMFDEALAPPAVLQGLALDDARDSERYFIDLDFSDSPQSEARILQAVEQLAIEHDLKKKPPQPGFIGLLGEWSVREISLKVLRESSKEIEVSLEGYGKREVPQKIAANLRPLSSIVRTRRGVSLSRRIDFEERDSVTRVVETIAKKYGLHDMDRLGMFDLANFGSTDMKVSVSFFESDSKIAVSVEDLGWHTQLEEIELALRSALIPEKPH